ncbi:MAG TPA: hypothetical protein VF198_07295 [Vicinamibacterales bacterium]
MRTAFFRHFGVLAALPFLLSAPLDARQQPATAPINQPSAAPVPLPESIDANETRERLEQVMRQYPPSLREVLRNDPSLLSSDQYLATYPALAAFVARHPEVARNPAFFFGTPDSGHWNRSPELEMVHAWTRAFEALQVFAIVATFVGAIAWLIKLFVDYRRWLRLSKVQFEVHTKLMDRLASNEDLLAYIQTPAGRRFLELAPIPVDAGEPARAIGAPYSRMLWSIQAGIVAALGGVALLVVGKRQTIEAIGSPLESIGIVVIAVGVGFVLSAFAAWFLSQRLGLLDGRQRGLAAHETTGA